MYLADGFDFLSPDMEHALPPNVDRRKDKAVAREQDVESSHLSGQRDKPRPKTSSLKVDDKKEINESDCFRAIRVFHRRQQGLDLDVSSMLDRIHQPVTRFPVGLSPREIIPGQKQKPSEKTMSKSKMGKINSQREEKQGDRDKIQAEILFDEYKREREREKKADDG